jgi:hypothetical protein
MRKIERKNAQINFTYFRDDKFSFNYDHKFEKICKVSRLSINRGWKESRDVRTHKESNMC